MPTTVVVHRRGQKAEALNFVPDRVRKFRAKANQRRREAQALAELEKLFSKLGERDRASL